MGHAGYGTVCAKEQTGTNSHSMSSEPPFLPVTLWSLVSLISTQFGGQHKAVVTLASAHIISTPVLPTPRHPVTGGLHMYRLYTGEEKGPRRCTNFVTRFDKWGEYSVVRTPPKA